MLSPSAMTILNLVVSAVTLAAFVVALVQLRDARKQSENLIQIQGALSTRYLTGFPDYMPQVIETLKSAQHRIIIFCDYPSYSSFSDPAAWLNYRQVIEQKIQAKVEVTLVCLDAAARAKKEQAHYQRVSWEEKLKAKEFRSKVRNYLHMDETAPRGDAIIDEFKQPVYQARMEQDDIEALGYTFRGAHKHQISEHIPLLFWLADDKQAVFAFPGYTDSDLEHGFISTDEKLLKAFVEIKDRYCEKYPEEDEVETH